MTTHTCETCDATIDLDAARAIIELGGTVRGWSAVMHTRDGNADYGKPPAAVWCPKCTLLRMPTPNLLTYLTRSRRRLT